MDGLQGAVADMKRINNMTMKILLSIILVLSATACASLLSSNYRTFVRDSLWAQGRLSRGRAIYHGMYIGNPKVPFSSSLSFYIRIAGDHVLSSDDFIHEGISELAYRRDETTSDLLARGWERQQELIVPATLYTYDRYQFVFAGTNLITFRAMSGSEISRDGVSFYQFPMDQSELERVVGPPDAVHDYYLW